MLKRFSPHRENHSVVIATICDKVCICFQDCDCSSVYVAFEFHAHFNFHGVAFLRGICRPRSACCFVYCFSYVCTLIPRAPLRVRCFTAVSCSSSLTIIASLFKLPFLSEYQYDILLHLVSIFVFLSLLPFGSLCCVALRCVAFGADLTAPCGVCRLCSEKVYV